MKLHDSSIIRSIKQIERCIFTTEFKFHRLQLMNLKSEFFHNRVRHFEKEIVKLKSRSNTISVIRLAGFIFFVTSAIIFMNLDMPGQTIAVVLLFIGTFVFLVKWHNEIKASLHLGEKMAAINHEEIRRLKFDFEGLPEGLDFTNEKHAYSGDLDLYGKNSLFQMISRAATTFGVQRLRTWLEHPAEKSTIEIRQNSIKELALLVDWRQQIQAHGKKKPSKSDRENGFTAWLHGDDKISSSRLYRALPYLITSGSTLVLAAVIFGWVPWSLLLLPFVLSGIFLLRIANYSNQTYQMTISGVDLLQSIEQILILIEKQKLQHGYLTGLQDNLFEHNHSASAKILKLKKILDLLNLRGNQMYHIFNSIFLLDFILLKKAENWRKRYKSEISKWFDTIAEFEALNSMAAFAFANEGYVYPEISARPMVFKATNLGHPLIPENKRVCNDFEINGRGSIVIVTGSNMAGKSTFLRTVGINAVLALSGAPVCADVFSTSCFQVFTSMRTKDNLEENISSFYAELLRLKFLLETINEQRPVLFLLDEILKGTNSADRHTGAESLAIQLSKMNAFGLISTHDLQLGTLSIEGQKLRNYNFSSEIYGEEIVFDYKLRPGICESTNASQLMAKIGIKINLNK